MIQTVIAWGAFVGGILTIVGALINTTRNLASALFFKVIPFFAGTLSVLAGLLLMGVIK